MEHIDTGGDDVQKLPIKNKTPLDDTADIRDILSEFAVKGYQGVGKDQAKANFDKLTLLVGKGTAMKLINSVDIFQQSPQSKVANPEDKIQAFYNLGSNDKEVSDVLKRVNAFGTGVKSGARTSASEGLQQIEGRTKPTGKPDEKAVNETKDIAKKVAAL
jgi:hypothetical protein